MASVEEYFGKTKNSSGLNIRGFGKDPATGQVYTTFVVRLLPPMGDQRATGKSGKYFRQHYGYGVPDPRDPTKTKARPFLCIEEKDSSGMTTVSCPECRLQEEKAQESNDNISKEVTRLRATGVDAATAERQARAADTGYEKWKKAHNTDSKYYSPVFFDDGTAGFLKCAYKGFKAIDKTRRNALEADKVDLEDIKTGAWLKVTRTGTGLSTEFEAVIVRESVVLENGVRAAVIKSAPLSMEQLQQAVDLPSIDSLVRPLDVEQIRMLVASGGDPAQVETILGLSQKAAGRPAPVQAQAPVRAQAPAPAPKPVVSAEDEEIAKLQAQMAALQAKKAVKAPAAPAPKNDDPTPFDDVSDDEFMARFPPPGSNR